MTCYCCLSAECVWGVVLILNKTGVHAIDFPERARRNTRNYNRMSPKTEQLVYEIECVLRFVRGSLRNYKVPPFKGEKKIACFFSSGCLRTTTHPRSRGYTSVCALLLLCEV